jgi:hypothetical protein
MALGTDCSNATPCINDFGDVTVGYTRNDAQAMVAEGSGTARTWIDPSGVLHVGYDSGTVSCTAPCEATGGVTAWPPNVNKKWSWTYSGGNWDANGGTSWRAGGTVGKTLATASPNLQISDNGLAQSVSLVDTSGTSGVLANAGAMTGPAGTPTCTDGSGNVTTSGCAGAGSGGGAKLIDWQKQTGQITLDTGTDTAIYSTSIPGGTIAAGACLLIHTGLAQTTGGGSITIKLKYGSTGEISPTFSLNTSGQGIVNLITSVCNDPGATNQQQLSLYYAGFGNGYTTEPEPTAATDDSTATQTLSLTMNASLGGTAVGRAWLVEVIR